MGKNSHLHLVLESEVLAKLKIEAQKRSISVSELCRLKLVDNIQLDRIENIVVKILSKNEK